MIRRQNKGTFYTPTLSKKTSLKSFIRCAIYATPSTDIMSDAINCNQTRIATVFRLLGAGCPSHIANFIMPIIINTIKGMFISGAISNVSQELFKRLKAKLNPASAVTVIQIFIGIVTSLFSPIVGFIFRHIVSIHSFNVPHRTASCKTAIAGGLV